MTRRRLVAIVAAFVFTPAFLLAIWGRAVTNHPINGAFVVLALLVALLGSLLSYLATSFAIGREVARPLATITERARAMSSGETANLAPLELSGTRDLDPLIDAVNALLAIVQEHVAGVEESGDQLRQAIARLGDALSSTHDRATILEAVLEMSVLVARADRGVLWLPRGEGFVALFAHRAHEMLDRVVPKGSGLAGWVGHHDLPRRIDSADELNRVEPLCTTALAVPLHNRGRVFGVIAVYGRADEGAPLGDDELLSLRTLAVQAEAAVENTFLHEEANRLSITDVLTGLWNRRHLDVRLAEELERSSRFLEPFSVILGDIDSFKGSNDEHGHLAGDRVLVEVARRLRTMTREVDMVARFGGEEFVVVLPRTNSEGGRVVAEKLRGVIEDEPFNIDVLDHVVAGALGPRSIRVTMSFGVASYPENATDVRSLLQAADEALLRAKAAGKNRVDVAARHEGVR